MMEKSSKIMVKYWRKDKLIKILRKLWDDWVKLNFKKRKNYEKNTGEK